MMADVRVAVGDRLAEIQHWLSGVTALEWVLLALAVAAIVWVFTMVRAATRLGPIEVAKVEGGDDADGLTARMREAVAHVGFRPPPSVPAGAPQADLLSAIEASPVPQANWIASLIKLIPWPQPRSYRLTTTILGDGWQVAYWLEPLGPGTPRLDTVDESIEPALTTIPNQILIHVSADAPDLFPAWAQWRRADALEAYLEGLRADDDTAREAAFARATACQRDNAIACLRLFNVREKLATSAGDPAAAQATVLREYLGLVTMHPELVEGRFRASSLAGVVARAYADRPGAQQAIRKALKMPGDDIERRLWRINRLGLAQAVALLRPWFVPVVWQRPRCAAEPQGYERRRLKRTLTIAKASQRARRHAGSRWAWLLLARSKAIVRVLADRSVADWQVYYNAGCFYALLGNVKDAFRFVNRALDSGGLEQLALPAELDAGTAWIQHDPDLACLREQTARWDDLVCRRPTGVNRAPRRTVFEALAVFSIPFAAALGVALVVAVAAFPILLAVATATLALYGAYVVLAYLNRARRLYNAQKPS